MGTSPPPPDQVLSTKGIYFPRGTKDRDKGQKPRDRGKGEERDKGEGKGYLRNKGLRLDREETDVVSSTHTAAHSNLYSMLQGIQCPVLASWLHTCLALTDKQTCVERSEVLSKGSSESPCVAWHEPPMSRSQASTHMKLAKPSSSRKGKPFWSRMRDLLLCVKISKCSFLLGV